MSMRARQCADRWMFDFRSEGPRRGVLSGPKLLSAAPRTRTRSNGSMTSGASAGRVTLKRAWARGGIAWPATLAVALVVNNKNMYNV